MSSPSLPDEAALPPPASLAIHLDLLGGLAGDMFVAAMVDALPALAAPLLAELAAVQPAGVPAAEFGESANGGLRAKRFGIAAASQAAHRAATSQVPTSDSTAARHTAYRTVASQAPLPGMAATSRTAYHAAASLAPLGSAYPSLRRRLVDAPLSASTREHALALLALLADAEARVHGTAPDDVHFHELADWDSLMDVVAAGCIAAKLAGARWTASAPPLGGGSVHTAHGLLPVPAPATCVLLTGYPWHDDGIAGERVTPTGAAILRHLVPAADCNARRDAGRLLSVGCGTGTRTLPGIPNIVRALVLDRTSASDVDADVVAVLEFDVDDMTGEEIALAADRLRAHAGVIDVSVGTRQGKKGRPVASYRLLARPHATDALTRACFTETSTLGLRIREDTRRVLRRAEVAATVDGATVRVKVAERPGGERTAKAAQDDVVSAGGLGERRRARSSAVGDVLKGGSE